MKIISAFLFLFLLAISSADAKTLLYVTHESLGEVRVYDADSEKIIRKIAVKGTPYHLAILPDKKGIAVSLKGESADYIRIIDPASGKLKQTPSIIVGRYRRTGEVYLQFNNDGKKLYAIDGNMNYVDIIETGKWKLAKRVMLGAEPKNGALTHDGKTIIIPNLNSGDIAFFDTSREKIFSSIKIDGQPSAVSVSRDGKTLYIADKKKSQLLFANPQNGKVFGRAVVGNDPVNMLLSPDGLSLYVANFSSNSLTVVNTKDMEGAANIAVGIRPLGMAIDSRTGRLYVCNYGEASIAIIDIKTNRIIRKIPTDAAPTHLIIVGAR